MVRCLRTIAIAISIFAIHLDAHAATVTADPSTYVAAVANLNPGDRLELAAGTYADCMVISGHHASANAPTVITGPTTGAPAIFLGTNCLGGNRFTSATIQIVDSSHLVVENLELDGEGLALDGVEADYSALPSHHITLQGLYIHDHDLDSGVNAISTKAPVWDWTIRNNRLINNGLGMYLGDSDGTAPFIRGTIEYNLILNPKGYGTQIKHQNPRPAVTGLPADGGVTFIRHNVYIKAARGVVNGDERPNLLVGHFPLSGVGVNDRYEIYGNFFYQNDTNLEPLFQGEGNIAMHDNVLVNTFAGDAISIRPHNDVPKDIAIYRNTILAASTGISVTGADSASRQVVVGNAVFVDGTAIVADSETNNVVGTRNQASNVFVDATPTLGTLDLYPKAGQLAGSAIDFAEFATHTDYNVDFNGDVVTGVHRGAYAGEGTNPGWMLAEAIKAMRANPPPRDGGVDAPDTGIVRDGGEGVARDGGVVAERDAGANTARDGGPVRDAGAKTTVQPTSDEGCGCDTTGAKVSGSLFALLAVLAMITIRRRGD